MRAGALVLALLVAIAGAPAGAAERVALLGVEWLNTSPEPTRPDETARLAALERQLTDALVVQGYVLVDTGPVADRAATMTLRDCPACALGFARELEADLVLLAWVQKVSNLILNINLQLYEVASGRPLRAGSVDIRGNTDESWRRGLRWLLERRLFPAAAPTSRTRD
jgi:hypothetical protein